MNPKALFTAVGITLALAACAGTGMKTYEAPQVPDAVKAPSDERVALWTKGSGDLTYECRAKKDMAGQFEWGVVGPVASLRSADGAVVGKYYAGPTWEANDGSKVSGKQVGVAPNGAANIPLQLVKADPAMGNGAMQGVTHIQRISTRGGIAPTDACGTANVGMRMPVKYEADYLFYKKS